MLRVKRNALWNTAKDFLDAKRGVDSIVSAEDSATYGKSEDFYAENIMPPTIEQAVIMLSSHFYESRDGSTGGFFADNVQVGQQTWNTVNVLLRLNRDWRIL
ncbi:hypothetical protein FACS1894105_01580 [Clostridia bacterium]|nr:hypothetical protein FACS1894105_01410 [Clostridia bacterium]GHU34566.1 hypothetical protein FACS1894105_01580 [Clostridia bacterium]